MGCTDIRDCGRGAYCLALALYKIQFEEIWHHEIKDIVKKLNVFDHMSEDLILILKSIMAIFETSLEEKKKQ